MQPLSATGAVGVLGANKRLLRSPTLQPSQLQLTHPGEGQEAGDAARVVRLLVVDGQQPLGQAAPPSALSIPK